MSRGQDLAFVSVGGKACGGFVPCGGGTGIVPAREALPERAL